MLLLLPNMDESDAESRIIRPPAGEGKNGQAVPGPFGYSSSLLDQPYSPSRFDAQNNGFMTRIIKRRCLGNKGSYEAKFRHLILQYSISRLDRETSVSSCASSRCILPIVGCQSQAGGGHGSLIDDLR